MGALQLAGILARKHFASALRTLLLRSHTRDPISCKTADENKEYGYIATHRVNGVLSTQFKFRFFRMQR